MPASVSPQREDKKFGTTDTEWPLVAEMQQRLQADGVRVIRFLHSPADADSPQHAAHSHSHSPVCLHVPCSALRHTRGRSVLQIVGRRGAVFAPCLTRQLSYCGRRHDAVRFMSCAGLPYYRGHESNAAYAVPRREWGRMRAWELCRLNSILEYRAKYNVDALDPLDALSHPCKPYVRTAAATSKKKIDDRRPHQQR